MEKAGISHTDAEASLTCYRRDYQWLYELCGGNGKAKELVFKDRDRIGLLFILKGSAISSRVSDTDIAVSLSVLFSDSKLTGDEFFFLGPDDIGAYIVKYKKPDGVTNTKNYDFVREEYPPDVTKEVAEKFKQQLRANVFGTVREFVDVAARQAQPRQPWFTQLLLRLKPIRKF